MGGRHGIEQAGFIGVTDILLWRDPFQIGGGVVAGIAVDVVDLGQLIRVWDKRLGHQAVDIGVMLNPVFDVRDHAVFPISASVENGRWFRYAVSNPVDATVIEYLKAASKNDF